MVKLGCILSKTDIQDIKDTVKAVESATSGEVVVVLSKRSSRYTTTELIYSIIFGYIFAFVYHLIFKDTGIFGFIGSSFLGMLFCFAFLSFGKIKRLFLSANTMLSKVHQAAFKSFYKHGVYRTKHKTGILIYISLMERMVVVVGDEGINSKLVANSWDDVVAKIIIGIKEHDLKKGIVEGLKASTALLRTHFPISSDDVNELNDSVIIEECL